MKNVIKLMGTIALAAVIAFLMTACPTGTGGGGASAPQQENETPLQFKGKTASGEDVVIEISRTAIKAVITPKDGDYYVIKVGGNVVSQGTIKMNGSSVTFTPSSGMPFDGSLDNVTLVVNIPSVGNVTLASGGEGKSVTITNLPDSYSTSKGNTNYIGVWLFNEVYGDKSNGIDNIFPYNTAIQSINYTIAPVFNLVIPRDNTWNSTNGKSQPRWNGNGDYLVAIVPIIDYVYSWDDACIYTNSTNDPVKVSFSDSTPNKELDFSKFKKQSELNWKTGLYKTLTITGDISSVFIGTPPFNAITAIVPVGTAINDVEVNLVAWCFNTNFNTTAAITDKIPLFISGNSIRWNGSGTFDVYYGSYTGTWGDASFEIKTMFQASSVNFNSADTTVAWSSFTQVMP